MVSFDMTSSAHLLLVIVAVVADGVAGAAPTSVVARLVTHRKITTQELLVVQRLQGLSRLLHAAHLHEGTAAGLASLLVGVQSGTHRLEAELVDELHQLHLISLVRQVAHVEDVTRLSVPVLGRRASVVVGVARVRRAGTLVAVRRREAIVVGLARSRLLIIEVAEALLVAMKTLDGRWRSLVLGPAGATLPVSVAAATTTSSAVVVTIFAALTATSTVASVAALAITTTTAAIASISSAATLVAAAGSATVAAASTSSSRVVGSTTIASRI